MSNKFNQFKHHLDQALELVSNLPVEDESLNKESGSNLVDTPSLLKRCNQVYERYNKDKPELYIIHHLPCSGGAQLSNYLSFLPNTYVLNEVHPYKNVEDSKPSLSVSDTVSTLGLANEKQVQDEIFLKSIREIYNSVASIGGKLVIRDNAYFDYFSSPDVNSCSILNILSKEFKVVSLVLVRDIIDGYSSLKNENLHEKRHLSFDDYCKRVKKFLHDYESIEIIKFEDLDNNPDGIIRRVCDLFSIQYSDDVLDISYLRDIPRVDNWFPSRLDCYNNKLDTSPTLQEIEKSKDFFYLQSKLKVDKRKLILIATMPRSGSTWLFNCVRNIYNLKNIEFYSNWVDEYDPTKKERIHIVKIHHPEHRLSSQADCILSSRRDVRNVCVSLHRMGWLNWTSNSVINQADYLVNNLHPFWCNRSDLEIEYDTIINNSEKVIRDIATTIGISLSPHEVETISSNLKNITSPKEYDRETQLHPNHRSELSTDFHEKFSTDLLDIVNKEFETWLRKYSYIK